MRYGYSLPGHTGLASMPIGAARPSFLRRLSTGADVREDDAARQMRIYRMICLLAGALLLAFGAVFKLTDGMTTRAFWPEAAMAGVAVLGLGASYHPRVSPGAFRAFVQALCFGTMLWFVALAAYSHFAPSHAIGLVFIIPGIGVAYSVSLSRIKPLALYFATSIGATLLCYAAMPEALASPSIFAGSLVCMSAFTLIISGARLQAERRFVASETRYRAVVEQASDGIYLLDAETLRFLDANPAFCRMVGYSLDELQSLTILDLVLVGREKGGNALGHLFSGVRAHVSERWMRRKNGQPLCIELHIDRIQSEGRELLSAVVHDVGMRKEYEARLIHAKENAEEIARFKSTLLTNMSHEVRTPLSSILGWSAVLREEVDAGQRELVDLITESGQRLHSTLDAVLELAHLDANSKELQPAVFDVVDEVSDTIREMQDKAHHKGIALMLEKPLGGVWVKLDTSCLRRTLTHLIDNAIKFTQKGSVVVSIATRHKELRVRVKDTGVGISEAFMPSLFEEFKQGSEGLDRKHEGNGLGLAISKRLVTLLGGEIEVESRPGEGSCFTITVPDVVYAGERMYLDAKQVA